MLRAAVWTCGLFGAGAAVCQVYPAAWVEPLVLIGLGAALLAVSARSGARRQPAAGFPLDAAAPARAQGAPLE
jgi:hypothetical protein